MEERQDLISRQAAIDALCNDYCGGHQDCKYYPKCENLKSIQQLPSAEPKRGKWIDRGEYGDWEWQADGRGKHWHEWKCNQCKNITEEKTPYCPNCGADMRNTT